MKERFSLEGKVAVVTGGSGRLGRPIVAALLEHGARVVCAGRQPERVRERLGGLDEGRLDVVTLDVIERASVERAAELVVARHGTVDVLFNLAGRSATLAAEDLDAETWDAVMAVNVRGTFFCCMAFGRPMKEQRRGAIINVGSIYGTVSPDPRIYEGTKRANAIVYGASKAAIIQVTRYLAVHWAPYNIRVNCVSPGGLFNNQEPHFLERYGGRTPLGRMALPDDLQGLAVFLASDASSYVTGQNLILDGGLTAW
ncbi:MAG: SDR family oxidoreductase [Candidatus Rokubacteria bacterium]|nr:SDR family oxidoreductase [Candidatus Rokubacteria bacterium]